ncbi:orotate phosphoribosyltransferase [Devosia sp. XJ19-1]|uniref:Orotate phosphoribosyltransferase n=1 Tax=Devosia ureilytica TaxID=2952754 RepID=A0A9Q4AL37_9HYPH|nr:orotate phosphoribosyltransferase [Devosia ureilytica]MCP8882527.1 orotate phosphoribosyltransferase [Devosia ureilytica]MCP8885586.1 orotate phosphoribosyltransferase [Devosia ureilytica]
MDKEQVLQIFRDCGAMLEGHFILSSGLRSPVFLQKAKVFQYAHQTEKLCKALAERIKAEVPGVTKVVSPAIGGIIPGYETSRHLGVPALYTERVEGQFELRRGFEIGPDDRVIVVEDIVSTGLSIRECVTALRNIGANVVAAACLIDRSGGEADVGVPLISLIDFKVPAYPADQLPPELAAIPAIKPGSRGIQGVK